MCRGGGAIMQLVFFLLALLWISGLCWDNGTNSCHTWCDGKIYSFDSQILRTVTATFDNTIISNEIIIISAMIIC